MTAAETTTRRAEEEATQALLKRVFARYDPVALGAAVGTVAGLGLCLATVVLLLKGGYPVGPNLSLLGHYLTGYRVTWSGAALGLLEGGLLGFLFGYAVAVAVNLVIRLSEAAFLLRLELLYSMEGEL